MPNKQAFVHDFTTLLAADMTAIATSATVMQAIPGAASTDRYDCLIDQELIGFTDCDTTIWMVLERNADQTTPAAHVAFRAVIPQLTPTGLTHLIAVEQGGVLEAVGQVINFASGAVVTQVGSVISVVLSALSNPMTTLGDLILGGSSGTPTRKAVGTDGQVLTVDPSTHLPDWNDPAFVNPMTTQDDLVLGGASGIPTRLAKGTDHQVPVIDAVTHHVTWADPEGIFGVEVHAPDYAATGLTGATSGARFAGATVSGAPVSGSFGVGDFVIGHDGSLWICTVAGTPGTWVQVSGAGGALAALSDVLLASLTNGDVLTYNSGASKWENVASAGGPPSGTAGGDLSGTYPNPSVVSLATYPLPAFTLNNGFLKLDATHGALQLVAYGTASNTVCQGNDSRLSNSRTPTAHASTHAANGSDHLDWDGTIHGAGLHSARPSAAAGNNGYFYYETDTLTLFRSDGSAWTAITSPVGGAAPPSGAASGDLSGSYPSPEVVALQNDVLPSTVGNGFLKRTSGDTAWEQVIYGTAANTVTQGNDSRLSNARTPTVHHATHELGGTDMLEVETFIIACVHSARPAASNSGLTDNEGFLCWETDTQTLFRSSGTTWDQIALAVGGSAPPSGAASGDLTGSYPGPEVIALQGDALPTVVANGFLKRNAANTAWEQVAYGTTSNKVTQGNDSRLSDARTPTAHETTHLPAGSDAIDWTGRIHQADVIANRPAAAAGNAGCLFFSTDTLLLSRSDGSAWTTIASVNGSGGTLSQAYQTVQAEGSSLTQRSTLNVVGRGLVADDSGGVTRLRGLDPSTIWYDDDDFVMGQVTSGQLGKLGWLNAVSAGGSITLQPGESGHPGIVRINGSTGANLLSYIGTGLTTFAFLPSDLFDFWFVVRPTDMDALTTIRMGVGSGPASNPPPDGCYIEGLGSTDFAAGVMTWFGVTRAASSQTRTTTTATSAANAWLTCRVRRIDGTHIGFTVGATAELSMTATIPTTALGFFWHILSTSGSAARHLDIDAWSGATYGLAR